MLNAYACISGFTYYFCMQFSLKVTAYFSHCTFKGNQNSHNNNFLIASPLRTNHAQFRLVLFQTNVNDMCSKYR